MLPCTQQHVAARAAPPLCLQACCVFALWAPGPACVCWASYARSRVASVTWHALVWLVVARHVVECRFVFVGVLCQQVLISK
jgi:hypothetical protein